MAYFKSDRYPTLSPSTSVDAEAIPYEVIQARAAIFKSFAKVGVKGVIELPNESYRTVGGVEDGEHIVELGTVSDAAVALKEVQLERQLRLMHAFSAIGLISGHRFDMPSKKIVPVQYTVDPIGRDGIMVYMPQGTLSSSWSEGAQAPGFTAGKKLAGRDGSIVSFISVDPANSGGETIHTAATEFAQNRLQIGTVWANGQEITNPSHTMPVQESVMNGFGNFAGHVFNGRAYKQYKDYMKEFGRNVQMNGLAFNGFELVTPHIIFGKNAYEQFADGQIREPTALAPDFIQ